MTPPSAGHSNTITTRPLAVLLVTEAAATGVGRHVLDLAQGLLQRKVRVHLIYSNQRSDRGFRDRLIQLRGLKSEVVAMRRSPHPGDFRAWRELRRYIRREGPFDVVHGHGSKAGGLVRLLPATLAPIRIYTPHALITMDPQLGWVRRWVYLNIERWLGRRGTQLIAVSQHEQHHAQEHGIAPGRVSFISNGVAQEPLRGRQVGRAEIGASPDDVVVGYVGRLAEQKAPQLLLHAFKLARESAPQLKLLMIGEGPLRSRVENLRDRLALKKWVHMPGWQPASKWLAAMDMLAMSSHYEAMPYILIEALRAGLPVVTTQVGGADTLIQHGINGLIVPQNNPTELANAIIELALDPDRRAQMAAVSQRSIAHLTLDRMIEQTLGLYTRLCGQ